MAGLTPCRMLFIASSTPVWMLVSAFGLRLILQRCSMVMATSATHLLVGALREKVSVFVAVEALLDSAFSIIYSSHVDLSVYYYPVVYNFVGFAFGAKH